MILLIISATFRNFLELSAIILLLHIVLLFHTIHIIKTDLHSLSFCVLDISDQLQILPQILV
jgi:hypothetical protein